MRSAGSGLAHHGFASISNAASNRGSLRLFRKVKGIAEADLLPQYRLRYESEADQVLFYTKDPKKLTESLGNI
jgi:hypothetical protein